MSEIEFCSTTPSTVPCCACGGPVIEFVIPTDIWNAVVREYGPETDQEYLCLSCYLRKAHRLALLGLAAITAQAALVADASGSGEAEPEASLLTGPFKIVEHGDYWWVAQTNGGFRVCALVDIGQPQEYAQAICNLMNEGWKTRSALLELGEATLKQMAVTLSQPPPKSVRETVENLRGFRAYDGKRFVFILDDDQAIAEIESHVQERIREETEKLQKALGNLSKRGCAYATIEGLESGCFANSGNVAEYCPACFAKAALLRSTPDSKGDV